MAHRTDRIPPAHRPGHAPSQAIPRPRQAVRSPASAHDRRLRVLLVEPVDVARTHRRSRPEILPPASSSEPAPVPGPVDPTLELVESGVTLRQNNRREAGTILHVTSRLIVRPASLQLEHAATIRTIAAARAATTARTA